MTFDIVVAADLDWGIAKNNAIPWRCPTDMAWFRRLTIGAPPSTEIAGPQNLNAIVMGRKTAESIGKPLPKRYNLVVSKRENLHAWNRLGWLPDLATSLEMALITCRNFRRTFVIGGGQLYAEALKHPALEHIYLTRIFDRYSCDIRIPNLDESSSVDTRFGIAGYGAFEDIPAIRIERRIPKR